MNMEVDQSKFGGPIILTALIACSDVIVYKSLHHRLMYGKMCFKEHKVLLLRKLSNEILTTKSVKLQKREGT